MSSNPSAREPALEKAIRLFQYLRLVQRQRTTIVRRANEYRRHGDVVWFHELPVEPELTVAYRNAPERDDPWLVAERVPRSPRPELPDLLDGWVVHEGDGDEPPTLRAERHVEPAEGEPSSTEAAQAPSVERLDEHPEVQAAFDEWLSAWRRWREEERRREPLREMYKRVFRIAERAQGSPEEFELVLAVGLLAWNPDGHPEVQRHVITLPAQITFDEADGTLGVEADEDTGGPELDFEMLDAQRWPTRERREELAARIQALDHHPLDAERTWELLARIAHMLDADAQPSQQLEQPSPRGFPEVAFCPALILRRRGSRDLLRIFDRIIDDLEQTGDVPAGLAQLVEVPDDAGSSVEAEGETAALRNGEVLLPLEANEEQRRIVARMDRSNHTVVQGPPGTGKTHTLANVLAHLLAQGKRVLITAHTDRALRELRDKLPSELAALCVSVVGKDSTDLADLKVAVDSLAGTAETFDPHEQAQRVTALEERLGELRGERSSLHSRLVAAREWETIEVTVGEQRGTPAQLADRHRQQAEAHLWLREFVDQPIADEPPLANDEAAELLRLLRDPRLGDEAQARDCHLDLGELPSPEEFGALVSEERARHHEAQSSQAERQHTAFQVLRDLAEETRQDIRWRLQEHANQAEGLARRREPWIDHALDDVLHGRLAVWQQRLTSSQELLERAHLLDDRAVTLRITAPSDRLDALTQQAQTLGSHLASGGKLRTGMFAPKAVREASELLAEVRVDGAEITSREQCALFRDWAALRRLLDDAHALWADVTEPPAEPPPQQQLAWLADESAALGEVVTLGERLAETEQVLDRLEIPHPQWGNLEDVRRYTQVIDAADADQRAKDATARIDALASHLRAHSHATDHDAVDSLRRASEHRDADAYTTSHARVRRFPDVLVAAERRDGLLARLDATAPDLVRKLCNHPDADRWDDQLSALEGAWRWLCTDAWLRANDPAIAARLQRELDETEQRLRRTVTELTAARAWQSAVQRLGQRERAALKAYALAVRRLGKGTGKYAAERRREARQALRQCRGSVPAWVMPLYRIADTIDVERDAFDVVMIDEASQARVEAAFLQYLAPKVLVVGDDKQVSPTGAGIDQADLRGLSEQYLFDVDHQFTWHDPGMSLFDQARLRYGDVITLREHFRCMPEIIAFSNRIAYEPDGVPLIPLRQYGADRLDPIRTVYREDGYTVGSRTNVNPPEVEAAVEIVTKCVADPAYDGKTFGVISLTGSEQAREIEHRLLDELPSHEITARQLRCGDAADFQGSERDVMVLSMVAAPTPGRRLAPLTADLYRQRYNVAASRARDQMWVVHSLRPGELANHEGMRYQLLDYCLRTSNDSTPESEVADEVPDDVVVHPFDSLFEQHVYNRLRRHGYTVVPQYEVHGYRIDLVVIGGRARLAVECDGDYWHGREQYEADLLRQRTLERCGWEFERIRGSAFYRDPDAALQPLWERLAALSIHSVFDQPERPTPAADSVDATNGPHPHISAPASPGEPRTAESRSDLGTASDEDSALDDRPEALRAEDAEDGAADDVEMEPGDVQALGREDATPEPPASQTAPTQLDVWEQPADPPPEATEPAKAGEASERRERSEASDALHDRTDTDVRPAAYGVRLAPYHPWSEGSPSPDPTTASQDRRIAAIRRVVEVEGPVLADRVYRLIVRSAGGDRVGPNIAKRLNAASKAALRQGVVRGANPLDDSAQTKLTLFLPHTPNTQMRELGPRTLYEVPPGELVGVLSQVHERGLASEEWYRRVLEVYGLKRLTQPAYDRLDECAYLLRADVFPEVSGIHRQLARPLPEGL